MPKAKADPELVAQARELVSMGCSLREAAQTLGVTATTIKRWIDEPVAELPPAVLPAHMQPPEVVPIVPLDTSDPRRMVEQLITHIYTQLQGNMISGDTRQMGSLAATISKLTVSLRQLDAQAKAGADGIHVSAGEFAAASADLDAKLAARVERGGVIRCHDCNVALSVTMGLGDHATDAESAAEHVIAKPA